MLALCAALTAALAGCGAKDKPAAAPNADSASKPPATTNAAGSDTPKTVTSEPQKQQQTATVQTFYGDENGTVLVAKKATISFTDDESKYIAALNALKKAPDSKTISLFDGFTFRKASLSKGDLRLDVSINEDGNLGSPGEELLLQALQKALFQFPEVTSIYVTVDGKQVDSLMGHMDLPYPIKRK
jgi:hypothetical protein